VVTVAASASSDTFTFEGRMEFPNGDVFEGTGSGTSALQPGFQANNVIPSFTLSGPNLTGTCSGQWLVGPQQGLPPVPVATLPIAVSPPGSPVVEGSMDCALAGADGFAQKVGLTMALVSLGAGGQYEGAFGPPIWALSAGPLAVGNSIGAADVTNWGLYDLLGHIDIGGFDGEAIGHQLGTGPFALSGDNGQGFTLDAQCQDNTPSLPDSIPYLVQSAVPAVVPTVRLLTCTGTLGYGPPPNTVQLLLVLPVAQATNPYCPACATERTGVFVGT
jgi:hypothetical protein